MDLFKKIGIKTVSITVIFTLLFSFITSFSASAFDYPELKLNKQVNGKLSDYWGAVNYSLKISKDSNIKFTYSSTVKTEISVRNEKFNEKLNIRNRKNYNGTVFLKEGEYLLSIYNCTYKKGKYSLKINDITEYTSSISFIPKKFYMTVGTNFVLPIIKEPSESIIKSINWESSSPARAVVDQNGKVTAKSLGKSVIKATLNNGKSATATVFVNTKSYTVKKGERKVLPKINGKKVNWKNSNSSVVKLTKKRFKARTVGTAVLSKTIGKTIYTVNITVE